MTSSLFEILMLLAGIVTASNSGQRPVLRTSAEAVIVDVAVWDDGRPVRGLSMEDFELTDNGVPQQISVVAMGRGPIRVHVIADLGAAERPLRERIRAAVALVAAAATPEDELFLHRADFSLIAFPSVHSAPLHGFATSLDREAREWRVRSLAAFATASPSLTGLEQITSLCDTTGGTAWDATDEKHLAERIRLLLEEFRLRYEISYMPSGVGQAGWHEIGLAVKSRRVDRVSWRRGYMR